MPIVELHVIKGYSAQEKQRLGVALTNAVRFVVPAAPELVTVLIHDISDQNYYRGGKVRQPARAKDDPEHIVRAFLSDMGEGTVESARKRLSPDFVMQFPGTAPMRDIEDLRSWEANRYRRIAKTYDGFDAMQSDGDAAIVYCRGTLSGEWTDGSPFEGIRFIDRFEIQNDLITRQDVWNDIAETRAQA
ncbi:MULTISPECIES: tautomerase family protein [unclassified Ruegeria]|uniref:tautomerase family protein n=1 Tax=unclassified Ruegeria TaxID=2625375 RepID=UPI0014884019|nr:MULTISPECIES: tautomerase family protein [unclassified Ruegeria]